MAKQRFLIVDSDQKTLRVLEASLLKGGYSVTTSLTGADALEKISVSHPDLIISEVVLPQMSGYEFCKKIKGETSTRGIPFLFLTRLKSVGDKIKGLELGADDYLTKPIYLKEVLTRVKLLLEKKEKEKLEMSATGPKFAGSLSDIGVVDLIQTLELGNKTAEVHLTKRENNAALFFKKGKIIDAEVGQLKGEGAVYRLLNWSEGTFRVNFTDDSREDKIGKSNQALIMEGMRRIDELVRIQEELPPPSSVLVIDSQAVLSEHPQQFPVKIEELMAEFDGKSTIEGVVDRTGMDELEAYEIVAKLYFQGFLVDSGQRTSQAPLIFQKPDEKPEIQEDMGSNFLRPPEDGEEEVGRDVPMKAGKEEADEISIEVESPFLKPPQEIEAKGGVVDILGDKREKESHDDRETHEHSFRPPSSDQKDSKVIFLKPSQLAERLRPKEAKLQRDFWKDEPLISSLEKVLVGPEPAVRSEPQISDVSTPLPPPLRRQAPTFPSLSGAPRTGRDAAFTEHQERQIRAQPHVTQTTGSLMWKILAIAAPPLIIAAGLYTGKDYILAKLSPTSKGLHDVSYMEGSRNLRAEMLIKEGKNTEALALLNNDLERDPKNSKGYYLRGILRIKSPATLTQGLDDLRTAVVLSPNDKEATLVLGMELLRRKNIMDAIMFLKKAAELDPGSAMAYQGLGLGYGETKEYESAIAAFRKALEIDSGDKISRLAISKMYYETGSLEKARENLRVVLSQSDKEKERDIVADAKRYMELIEAKSIPSSSSDADRIAPGPSSESPPSRLRTASIAPRKAALKPSRPRPAGSAPKGAKSNEAAAYQTTGKVLYDEGKVKEAIVEYRLAMLLNPGDTSILVDLGNALFDDGKDKEAVDILEKALSLNPRNSRAHLSLGGIYSTKGDKTQAIMHYEKFLEIEPKGGTAEEVRTILKNLTGR